MSDKIPVRAAGSAMGGSMGVSKMLDIISNIFGEYAAVFVAMT